MKASAARGRVFAARDWSNRLVPVLSVRAKAVPVLPAMANPVPVSLVTAKVVRSALMESAQSVRTARSEANLNAIPESIPDINSRFIGSSMRIRQSLFV